MLKHIKWSDVELETLKSDLQRQMVVGDQVMLARILLQKGCVVPEHRHLNEQLSYILEGRLQFNVEGREIVVGPGEVLCIPSNLPHSAVALEDCLSLDVFNPPRQDWLEKRDAYLRGTTDN